MAEKAPATIDLMGWNVEQGGFDRRHLFDAAIIHPDLIVPEREDAIATFVRQSGVDSVALTDTYGWRQRYGSDSGIAQHLGFAAARFTPLNDDRIDNVLGPGAGITFATDHEIEHSYAIDLGNRQASGVILKLGERTLQIVTAYLDDMNETTRLKQLESLLNNIEPEPTVIIGDLNSLRPNMHGASIGDQVSDLGIRAVSFSLAFFPGKQTLERLLRPIQKARLAADINYYRQSIRALNERQVIRELERNGWQDSDRRKQSTFQLPLNIGLGLDYAFHNAKVQTRDFQILPSDGASDHKAVRMLVDVL